MNGNPPQGIRTESADGVAHVVLGLPPLNILTRAMLGELRQALSELQAEPDLRVLLIRAEGKHFSAGADVGEHLPPQFEEMIPEFMETVSALRDFPLPVVAAVRGKCLGGGFELAQGADLIVAGDSAAFGQPEIVLGVMAPAASALLPMLSNSASAAQILFTGDALSAPEAQRAGLVSKVVPDDEVEATALALSHRIARHSGAALRVNKRALRVGEAAARTAAFHTIQSLYVEDLMNTADAREGLEAFLEKRTPEWTNR